MRLGACTVQFIVEKLRLITRFFPSESLNSLYPLASLRPLVESIANLAAVDADIFQIPIAEMAQGDKVRLALAVCDYVVDETAEAHQKNSGSSPLERACTPRFGLMLDQHARCRVPGLSENGDLFSKCP